MQAMARKRKPGAGRPKGETPPKDTIASLKGSEAFEAWFLDFVKFCRMPKSSVLENALIEYAKLRGYNKPAPER